MVFFFLPNLSPIFFLLDFKSLNISFLYSKVYFNSAIKKSRLIKYTETCVTYSKSSVWPPCVVSPDQPSTSVNVSTVSEARSQIL